MNTKLCRFVKAFFVLMLFTFMSKAVAQNPNIYASAVWIDDCTTVGDGKFFNTSGSGADLINQEFGNTFIQNFGVHLQNSGSLILRGAEVKTQKDNNTNVCSTTLYYRFFENTQTPGAFQSMTLPFFSDCNTAQNEFFVGSGPCQSGQQKWQRVVAQGTTTPFAPINLTNTPPGNYILQVYYEFTGSSTSNNACNQTFVLDNSGNFYQSTFTVIADPSLEVTQPTVCDGLGAFTITGLTSNAPYQIRYTQNGNVVGPLALSTTANGQITISDLPLGTYTNITIISNGCNIVLPNSITIVNPVFTPTFDPVPAFCIGDSIPELPITSVNGFTGSWSPEMNNQETTTYTFTPDPNQCAESVTLTITITPLTIPTFTPIVPICEGENLDALSTTSNNGIDGIWAPELNNTITTTYTFTPNDGQCADSTTLTIVVNPTILPEFSAVAPICVGETLLALPTTSLNGIIGSWSPDLNNTQTTTYIFTPDAGQCALDTSLTIEVNPIQIPEFDGVAPICIGESLAALPTTSLNGVVGSWSPALNNQQTTTYTFVPDAGQCANEVTLTIVVNAPVLPEFAAIDPICEGDALTLPTTSLNGFSGSWSPPINTTQTTTYTFTPDDLACASETTLTVVVTPGSISPSFSLPVEICQGIPFTLPMVSENGISGSWLPVFNPDATTTYTFIPDAGQCAVETTFTINITPRVMPQFGFGSTVVLCEGAELSLPETSSNGISGSWFPAVVNPFVSNTYKFTPDEGFCAQSFTLSITIEQAVAISLDFACEGNVYTARATATGNVSFQWQNASGVVVGTGNSFAITAPGSYTLLTIQNNCVFETPFSVDSNYCDIPRGISPNNDGLNDFWDLSNLDVSKAQIFNRYGMEVFSRNNYTAEWEGRDKSGRNLPSGTYYYVVTFRNGTQKTGWVYVQREE